MRVAVTGGGGRLGRKVVASLLEKGGVVHKEGPPAKMFGDLKRARTRSFLKRIPRRDAEPFRKS